MELRLKLNPLVSSDGFDFIGRPLGAKQVHTRIIQMKMSWQTKPQGVVVFWKEKHRAKTTTEQLLTPSGKLSKKVKKTFIPTHWRFKIWVIPNEVIKLLADNGKVIKQYKDHWNIVTKQGVIKWNL